MRTELAKGRKWEKAAATQTTNSTSSFVVTDGRTYSSSALPLSPWFPGQVHTGRRKNSERQRVTQNGSVSKHWFCTKKSPANVRYHVPGCHLCTTYIAALYSGQKRLRASCLAQGGFGDTVAFPAVLRVLTVITLSQLASLTRRCEAWTSLHVFRAHARVHTVLVVPPGWF